MKYVLPHLILLICCLNVYPQSAVFNPADPIVNYDKNQPAGSAANPTIPYNNQIVKWVRTPKVAGYPTGTPAITWNTNNYKCYMVNNLPFRMRYPNGYVPGTNDGKKFPIMIFWHGGGECEGYYTVNNGVYTYHAYGNGVWDNEYQLYQGAQAFETKTTTDQDAFILFPQSPVIGFDGSQFAMMNVAIDEIINNCKGDPDRVISMGLSVGGLNCIQYALAYPQRVSSIISSSGIQVNTIANSMGPAIHIPLWYGNGGKDTSPDSSTAQIFENGYTASGGIMLRSYLPLQSHVMWDYQWAEEPSFDSAWSQAHKANPLVYNNNRFFCPGSTNISASMGITPGYYAYRWDKDGVIIPGANSSNYTATAFGTYRCSFMRTSTSAWSAWSLAPAKIVAVCPPVTGNGTGLAATYFSSNNLTNPVVSRLDPNLNFYIENGASPAAGIAANTNYSVRWTGKIQSKFTEPYTLYTFSDDGVRLWFNGQLVIDNWTTHGGTENSATVSMVAGQQYDIKIEYYNNFNYQNVYNSINSYITGIFSLRWSSPSTVKTTVPKTQLYPTGTSSVPSCVTNTSPTDGSTIGTPTTATLTWPSSSGATSYDVYLWTGATAPASPTANVTTTSYNASGLTSSTLYNWYIAPKNANGTASGCAANKTSFTTASTSVPSCVVNTSPANGSTIGSSTSAILTWPSASSATSYDVYLWTGATAPASPTANVATTSYNASGLTASTLYSWYIAPRNAIGAATGCATSNKTTFTTAAPSSGGDGLQGVYYNGTALSGTPLLTRVDPTINFDLTWMSPAPGIVPQDNYSVRWTGQVQAVYTETYTFYTTSDDGIRLWVNGVQLVNDWVNQGATEYSGSIALVAGQKYDIVIEYYEATGDALTKLSWSSASTPKAIVPQSQLYLPGAPSVPGCVVNTSPANGSTIATSTTATLTWPVASGATSYDVYIWTGATVPSTPTVNTSALTYSASGLTASTTYSWYIAPRNATGVATGCAATNKTTFTTAAAGNQQTVSNAGSDVTITLPTSSVTLDGSASTGNIVQYYWYQAQGPVASVIGDNFSTITTASGLTTAGTYVFGLQVRDNSGAQAYSFKTVTVKAAGTRVVDTTAIQSAPVTTTVSSASALPVLTSGVSSNPVATGQTASFVITAVISPNPVQRGQLVKLQINSSRACTVMINTISSNGALTATSRLNLVAGINTTALNTYGLVRGFHAINITGGDKPLNLKLMVE